MKEVWNFMYLILEIKVQGRKVKITKLIGLGIPPPIHRPYTGLLIDTKKKKIAILNLNVWRFLEN